MGLFFRNESAIMYERFKSVSKDITDRYKKPLSDNGYTEDDNKAVEELIIKMEKLNSLLNHYDNQSAQIHDNQIGGCNYSGGSGDAPKSFRNMADSIFGTNR